LCDVRGELQCLRDLSLACREMGKEAEARGHEALAEERQRLLDSGGPA